MDFTASSIRDRSVEFYKAIYQINPQTYLPSKNDKFSYNSPFMQIASSVGKDLTQISNLISQVGEMNFKQNIFEDSSFAIDGLINSIKERIGATNHNIAELQRLQFSASELRLPKSYPSSNHVTSPLHAAPFGGGFASDTPRFLPPSDTQEWDFDGAMCEEHLANIVRHLRTTLAAATQQFAATLETRTATINKQRDRKSRFSTATTALLEEYDDKSRHAAVIEMESGGGGYDSRSTASGNMHATVSAADNAALRRRGVGIAAVESAINEVANIYQHLARMITEQGESLQRIDANIEMFETNVDAAHIQLAKFYNNLSSDRKLMLKLFGLLLLTVVIFVFVK